MPPGSSTPFSLANPRRRRIPDLTPAIQEAAQEATSRALADLLKVGEAERKRDTEAAEEALDKRQAEIKSLTERIARGQEKIEKQVQARGETDIQTRALLEQMGQTIGNLNSETAGLKKALRQPQTRGQWGELQLRRCVEIAGMTEHVDFELQQTLRTEDGSLRPDARFLLPEGRSFVADSKVPLDAFLDAQETRGRIGAATAPRAPRPAGARARPQPQLEGLPGSVQPGRDARPGDLLHPQRAGPARRLRSRSRRSSTTPSSATSSSSARPR